MTSDINIKTVLLGSSKAGKTSLVRRFVENTFIDSNDFVSTIGGAFISKEISSSYPGRVILCIWDTAGEEKYESVTRTFYRNANAAIVCYDVTNPKSWIRAKSWVTELKQFEEKCVIYLCATKLDLVKETSATRAIPESVLHTYITSANIKKHVETSSKSGENVDSLFRSIASDYLELNKNSIFKSDEKLMRPNQSSKSCCLMF